MIKKNIFKKIFFKKYELKEMVKEETKINGGGALKISIKWKNGFER